MIRVSLQQNIDPSLLKGRASKLETALAWQIMKDTTPFVPALTLSLTQRTRIVDSYIIYPGPYARYLWFGKRMVNAATGKGPRYIPEVGWRWPRGATLRPTDQDINIQQTVHADATSHWLEVSKQRNMERWQRIGATIYTNGR